VKILSTLGDADHRKINNFLNYKRSGTKCGELKRQRIEQKYAENLVLSNPGAKLIALLILH
jgi:hypothetical protein